MFNLNEAQILQRKLDESEIIRSGYDDFDFVFKGFYIGNVTIFASRPMTGKTSLFLNLAYNIAEQNKKVLYYSNHSLRNANKILKWQKKTDISLYFEEMFVFDECKFIQQLQDTEPQTVLLDVNSLAFAINKDILNLFKKLAQEYHFAMIIGANLNRDLYLRDDKKPIAGDLHNIWRQEDIIENADDVYLIYRESLYFNVPFEAEWVRIQISNIRYDGKYIQLYLNKNYEIKVSDNVKEQYFEEIDKLFDKK